jgi:hypothetical protein
MRLSIVLAVGQQVIGLILMRISIDWLPDDSQILLSGLLSGMPPLGSAVEWNGLDHDGRVLVWVISCHLGGFLITRTVLLLLAYPPESYSKWFGNVVFVCASIPFLFLHETWHELLVADLLHLALQSTGWWFYWETNVPADRPSDAREVWGENKEQKVFNPLKYMCLRRGVFVGLNDRNKPTFLPLKVVRQHIQIVGQTRSGKNVAVATLLDQSVQLGECVIVLDPKNDFYMSSVMAASAARNGVPFTFIDLRANQPPQLNLLAGCAPHEIEEMLVQVFDLVEKGDNADVFRIEDRAVVRTISHLGARSFPELVEKASDVLDPNKNRRLSEALTEIASLPVIQTADGVDLSKVVAQPGLLYVIGSTRHEGTIRLQKMVLLKILQLLDKAGLEPEGIWTSIFLDEFKYLLSPAALQALGVIADRRCGLRVAHQALGDLDDTSLPSAAVRGAVIINCALKYICRTNDPDTALWMARLTGSVPVFAEFAQKALFKFAKSEGSWREGMSTLFEPNVFLSLAPLHAILVGAGLPVKIRVGYLPTGERPTPIPALHRPIILREAI